MPQPNILLLFTDQQRYDSVACTHTDKAVREALRTPNLDRLCSEGIRFDRAYTPNPVCIPARYNMMTGLTARYHGHFANSSGPLPAGIPCFPQILASAGYVTQAVGKMHFQPCRDHHGFGRMEIMEETPHFRQDDDYLLYLKSVGCNVQHQHGVRHLLYHQPQHALIPEEHLGSTWVADRSIAFLEQAAGHDRPFLLKSSWILPHPPQNIPARLADMYKDQPLPPRIERIDGRDDRSDLMPSKRMSYTLGEGFVYDDPARMRRHREHYFAAVSFVDEQVGRILDTLDRLGMSDNTLVLFTSDHGEMLGDLDCLQKSAPYETAAHIPFIMRFPGTIAPGTADREHFVDLNDVLPTFLDAAGVKYPATTELPGSSLFDLDKGRDRTVQYIENNQGPSRWVCLRNAQYKYVFAFYGGWEALFDLKKDPLEQHNLLVDGIPPEYKAARDAMFKQLVAYEDRWGQPGTVQWNDLMKYQEYPLRTQENSQLPPWISTLAPAEKAELGDLWQEVIDAVKDEPTVTLSRLDLDSWAERCHVPAEVIKKIRKNGV